MASIKQRVTDGLENARERVPLVDRLIRMQLHYGKTNASQQAGAVTYFAFLSFFPLLAIAFFLIGYVAKVYPDAQGDLVRALQTALPGLIDDGKAGATGVKLSDIEAAAGAVGLIGLVTLLYSGLSWLSALRTSLITVFELPGFARPNFVIGKLRDLATLVIVGVTLVVSVAVSGVVTAASSDILDLLGLDDTTGTTVLLAVVAVLVGLAANGVLFYAMFKLLTDTETPLRSLLQGALLGAIGFEALKQLASHIIAATSGQPAFQAFGIALVLVVWINYFTRLVLYAAAFAYTSPQAREARGEPESDLVQGPQMAPLDRLPLDSRSRRPALVAGFAAGGATVLGLVAALRKRA